MAAETEKPIVVMGLQGPGEWRRERDTKTRPTRIGTLSPSTVVFLEMHRESQRQVAALFGSDYRTDLDFIFAGPSGDYIKPQAVSNSMRRHTKALGMPGIGIHSLRHSHASLLLSDGVPVAVVSKRLEHSSPATTQRIYSHSLSSEELGIRGLPNSEFNDPAPEKPA